ncbi:MAG: SRPBCC family protein [Bacteroidales bacterium]|jgi:hypothetical protein|nr:SRPBCC family protein [Bacteroidales bacterium]
MRVLKFFGFVLLFFLSVALLLALIMHDEVETTQSIEVKASPMLVFRQVNDLNNWKKWSPFKLDDPGMTLSYKGAKLGEGAELYWTSEDSGDGSLKIVKSEPYNLIQIVLDFGNHGIATDEWSFQETENGVVVSWSLKLTELSYPFGKYFGFFVDGLFNPLQIEGLEKLKTLCEQADSEITVNREKKKARYILGVCDTLSFNARHEFVRQNEQALSNYFKSLRYKPDGDALLILQAFVNDNYISCYGFPILDEVKESGRFNIIEIPECEQISAEMNWSETAADEMHQTLKLFLLENNLKVRYITEEVSTETENKVIRISYCF